MLTVYKYGTGHAIPKKAVYLSTVKQEKIERVDGEWVSCWLVWHYFLVDTDDI